MVMQPDFLLIRGQIPPININFIQLHLGQDDESDRTLSSYQQFLLV
jgi:hypothetical protein